MAHLLGMILVCNLQYTPGRTDTIESIIDYIDWIMIELWLNIDINSNSILKTIMNPSSPEHLPWPKHSLIQLQYQSYYLIIYL